ncbi:hypothetical protein F511_30787 [Dorcoceras hygrometricum]|uniref:Uncharacterized protein n=1 Tax=Dorcoceras hygrometricum TaxID=472368 RepID=A0A2Z7A906_9LAMI|nr:hypothetical protein F511_30787 [Dorcoceras hygrometricum]
METPQSTRRITRSHTSTMSRKVEESEKCLTKSRNVSGQKQQQDRSVLTDITNDSPIVGVAMGNLDTPSSAMSKKRTNGRVRCGGTPGSGEALLRGQVKTLLQKVEEEAELSKIAIENMTFFNNLQGLVKSPCISLVAPTPANTPQVSNFSTNSNGFPSVISDGWKQEIMESDNIITRSLLLDFSEKLESSDSSNCSSTLTYQGQICPETESTMKKSSTDDGSDDSSIWSMQANASSTREDEEEEEEEACEQEQEGDNFEGDYHYKEGEEHDDFEDNNSDKLVDDICEGISKISFHGTAKFTGKHVRFVYNSDDEEYTQVMDD